MFMAFALAALSLLLLTQLGHVPWMFVVLTALFFGVFGEIYSLFPATCGDTFGSKYAATNAGMLYTAKGTASALVPFASLAAANLWLVRRLRDRGRIQRLRRAARTVRLETAARRVSTRRQRRQR